MEAAANAQQTSPCLREAFSTKRADFFRKEESNVAPFAAILDAADRVRQVRRAQMATWKHLVCDGHKGTKSHLPWAGRLEAQPSFPS